MKGSEDMKIKTIVLKYKLLIVFIAVTVTGLAFYFLGAKKAWDIFGAVDTASAVALAILAFWGYLEYIKLEDEIKIYFLTQKDKKRIDTGISILRKYCTRSEVLGLLGMLQKDTKGRFNIRAIKDTSLLELFQKIQKGDLDYLEIPLSAEELEQFEINHQTEERA